MATQHPKIIFVLGPPGTGKGTQCALLEQSPPRAPRQHTATKTKTITIHHLSIGDMLRAELDTPTSKWGATIRANMAEGRTGPPEMSVAMLKGAMERKRLEMGTGGAEGEVLFLVDGFPRSTDRIPLFESTICAPILVLSLECPQPILQDRLLARAKRSRRVDDGVAIMHKRFEQHVCATKPVLAHYRERGLLAEIDARGSVEDVQGDVLEAVRKVL